jgi:hypothetical protein
LANLSKDATEVGTVELALVSIAIILGGTLVSDDLLNNRLRLGEKLANRFSKSSNSSASNVSREASEKTEVLTR